MTRALICTGVLGGGTAVVFALAFLVAILFPQGSLVTPSWNGGWAKPMAMPDANPGWDAPAPGGNMVILDDTVVVGEEAPPPPDVETAPEPAPTEGSS